MATGRDAYLDSLGRDIPLRRYGQATAVRIVALWKRSFHTLYITFAFVGALVPVFDAACSAMAL